MKEVVTASFKNDDLFVIALPTLVVTSASSLVPTSAARAKPSPVQFAILSGSYLAKNDPRHDGVDQRKRKRGGKMDDHLSTHAQLCYGAEEHALQMRDTINVVAVTHSISKDMKFDLGSRRYVAACAALSKVLARRALAEKIHNVVYTPRRVEKLEGKVLIVLELFIKDRFYVKMQRRKINKESSRK
ncbi:hypothetical protein AgCh_006371 [Apium graveolens]